MFIKLLYINVRSQSAASHESRRQHRCGVLQKPVHTETVTCLSTVRAGLVISGGKDSVLICFSEPFLKDTNYVRI